MSFVTSICDGCETVAHCMKHGCIPKVSARDEALKLALQYMDGTLVTDHLTGYERKRHVMEALKQAIAEDFSGVEQPAQPSKPLTKDQIAKFYGGDSPIVLQIIRDTEAAHGITENKHEDPEL